MGSVITVCPTSHDRLPCGLTEVFGLACRFDYIREHREAGINVIFANPSKKVVRQLEKAKLVAHIGAPPPPFPGLHA